ncbi:hypothetical protein Q1695_015284 [Nippostrongylus brasiliensis]|nr:hypothetical protein Q1695_015284 [Nippostrongylus brasiliensis]
MITIVLLGVEFNFSYSNFATGRQPQPQQHRVALTEDVVICCYFKNMSNGNMDLPQLYLVENKERAREYGVKFNFAYSKFAIGRQPQQYCVSLTEMTQTTKERRKSKVTIVR